MLAQFQGGDTPFQLLQNSWASALNPLLANPVCTGILLKNIALASGANTINHKLGRTPQGWLIIDRDGTATIYRSQPLNNLTLTLTSSASINVSLYVF